MRTVQQGDRVQVHYVKRLQDGSVISSRGQAPLQLTVGIDHPYLPGLGLALLGMVPGTSTSLQVPSERAYGVFDPARVHRWSRERFPTHATLRVGRWVRFTDGRRRRWLVRILEVSDQVVVVDTNHRWAGQDLELDIELLAIGEADVDADPPELDGELLRYRAKHWRKAMHPTRDTVAGDTLLLRQARAIALDVDSASLATIQGALSGWQIDSVYGATVASLPWDWGPETPGLFVVGVRADTTETLSLCRFLACCTEQARNSRPNGAEALGLRGRVSNQGQRADIPVLVLVPGGHESLVRALLEAGAASCLVLPIHGGEVVSMLTHARQGNRPGRHTLALDQAQQEDRWRDDGGQG